MLTYEQTLPMGLPAPEEEFKRDDQQQSSDMAVEMQHFSRPHCQTTLSFWVDSDCRLIVL